jgi:hypothetical protein
MKLSKEELSAKINDLDIDEEIKVSLMEDIADSIENSDTSDNGELEELKIKYESLREKYKERFLKSDVEVEEKEEDKEDDEELKEEEVIDVKEI